MIWVWVFLAIALLGIVVMVSYGVWLFHKAADVYSEITMLGKRAEEIQELLSRLELDPKVTRGPDGSVVRLPQDAEAPSKDLAVAE